MIATALCMSMAAQNVAYAAPVATKINGGYDTETWEKLNDDIIEYDEIAMLIHSFNDDINDGWDSILEAQSDLAKGIEEAESQEFKMSNLKDSAIDDGDQEDIITYTIQEAMLDQVISGLKSAAIELATSQSSTQLELAEEALTKAVQELMIQYQTLQSQLDMLVQLELLYQEQEQLVIKQQEQGLATQQEVLTATSNLLSMQISIQSMESVQTQLKQTMLPLLGWNRNDNPTIEAIPEVDLERVTAMDLENDTVTAIGNNQDLQSDRRSEKGSTTDGIARRLAYIEQNEQELTIEMKRLYDEVLAQQIAYEATTTGYQSATLDKEKYERMYQAGMLSKSDLLGAQVSYYQKKAEYETANLTLYQAINDYEWAIKGYATVA